ncbi:MAG: hypothetical protein KJ017_12000 [Alphaproteobacteria bacterium]|nr:hypothetical protein [Alphaproteobacteria bacterium]
MNQAKKAFLLSIFFISVSAPVAAQNISTVSYICDLGGAPGQLTAQIETINTAGAVTNSDGWITGVIGTGETTTYYQGELVSASARYVFTGENQYADFTDMNTNERFRVQMVAQGAYLTMVINPETPQPVTYQCQQRM